MEYNTVLQATINEILIAIQKLDYQGNTCSFKVVTENANARLHKNGDLYVEIRLR